MRTSHQGKTALITGASRGIGAALARELAKAGYRLHLTCRQSGQALRGLGRKLEEAYGIEAVCHTSPVGDWQAAQALFSHIGSLDVLINNAALSHYGLLQDMAPDQWRELMAVNLDGIFYYAKLAIPLMLRGGSGHILNISSVWGQRGASMEAAYSASKGGVDSLTKALAKELAPSGIRVNAISPGWISTDMNRHFDQNEEAALLEDIPLGRAGLPEEVARLALAILESPAYLTGQIIGIDGGWQI